MKIPKTERTITGIIALYACLAFIIMFLVTTNGPVVGSDSLAYFRMSDEMLASGGFPRLTTTNTHFPPAYPYALSLFRLIDNDVLTAGRIYHSVVYAIITAFIGIAASTMTRKNLAAVVLSMTVVLCTKEAVSLYSMALSEAQYTALALLALILFALHLAKPNRWLAAFAGLTVGLAILTRYVGATLLLPMILSVFVFSRRTLRQKLIDSAITSAAAILLPAAWFVRNLIVVNDAVNRQVLFHLIEPYKFKDMFVSLFTILFPVETEWWWSKVLFMVLVAVLFAVAARLYLRLNRQKKKPLAAEPHLVILSVNYFIIYLLFLFFSISFIDAYTPLNTRLLLPAFLFVMLAAIAIVLRLAAQRKNPTLWWSFVCFMLVTLTFNVPEAVQTAAKIRFEGAGYASPYWKYESPIVNFMREYESSQNIYTNGSEVALFLTGKTTLPMPSKQDMVSKTKNPAYQQELQTLCDELTGGQAILVYFNRIHRSYFAHADEIMAACSVEAIAEWEDGMVLGIKPPAP